MANKKTNKKVTNKKQSSGKRNSAGKAPGKPASEVILPAAKVLQIMPIQFALPKL